MSEPATIVLAGIGGYGEVYLAALLDERAHPDYRLVAVVDPEPERSTRVAQLRALDIPIFSSLEHFYDGNRADLAVLSTPIHLHYPQTCLALTHGSDVLCEKPAAATVQEVDRMLEAERRTRRRVAVGFQWSFSPPIQQLKRDILAGTFGPPRRARSLTLWPRPRSYYTRNTWAGRQRDDDGNWILDSPANNAMAHDLHNLLFLLGSAPSASALPVELIAETYRANPIENYDTVAARIRTDTNVDLIFLASHAIADNSDPSFAIEFEHATVAFAGGLAPIVATREDGSIKQYPSPNRFPQATKLWSCLHAAFHRSEPLCGLAAARMHTICINGIQDSVPKPREFPSSLISQRRISGDPTLVVHTLADVLHDCYNRHALPHELNITWAQSGAPLDLRGYRHFPGGRPA